MLAKERQTWFHHRTIVRGGAVIMGVGVVIDVPPHLLSNSSLELLALVGHLVVLAGMLVVLVGLAVAAVPRPTTRRHP